MPPPSTVSALDTAAFDCMERLDELRKSLIVVNVYAMSRAMTARDFDYLNRASGYLWVSAALEEFVKRILSVLIAEINDAGVCCKDLRQSLLTLDKARDFQALHSLGHPQDLRKWAHQVGVLSCVGSDELATLSIREEHWPIDGSTLHKAQLEAIWAVFGLKPDPVPSPRTYGFLTDLRENRTRAAHGEENAIAIGRQQSAQDALDLISRAEELGIHMHERGTSYLLGRDYLR